MTLYLKYGTLGKISGSGLVLGSQLIYQVPSGRMARGQLFFFGLQVSAVALLFNVGRGLVASGAGAANNYYYTHSPAFISFGISQTFINVSASPPDGRTSITTCQQGAAVYTLDEGEMVTLEAGSGRTFSTYTAAFIGYEYKKP